MKIIILDRATLGFDIDISVFETLGEVKSYDITKPNETIERLQDADIVITNKVVISKEVMDSSNLKLICISATGMNNVDLEYAKQKNAVAIVKGLRAVSDFDWEFQQSLTNKSLNPDVETVFLTAKGENMFLSSSMVKEVCSLGGDISSFVPPQIAEDIYKRCKGDIKND